MFRSLSRSLAAILPAMVIVLATSSAFAGRPGGGAAGRPGGGQFGGGGFGGGGGGGVMVTVLNAQVQTELELSDEQKESLTKLSTEARGNRADFQGLQDLSAEERTKKMAELREAGQVRTAETNKKVNEILLPSQQERLKQIILQTQGPQSAATNEDLAKALGLTDDQKQKIKDIAALTLQKLIEEKVLSVLTPDQQSKLESMKGKKFEFDRTAAGAGAAGGRGNRQRGGNNTPPATNPKSL